jgi:hypothetical protein
MYHRLCIIPSGPILSSSSLNSMYSHGLIINGHAEPFLVGEVYCNQQLTGLLVDASCELVMQKMGCAKDGETVEKDSR